MITAQILCKPFLNNKKNPQEQSDIQRVHLGATENIDITEVIFLMDLRQLLSYFEKLCFRLAFITQQKHVKQNILIK